MAGLTLLGTTAIPAAGTYVTAGISDVRNATYLLLLAKFDYGSGGTTVKAYIQTSVDGGVTWVDVACFAFALADANRLSKVVTTGTLAPNTTPTDGTLADNTVLDGTIGDRLRVKYVVAGTYAASTLSVWAEVKR